MISHSNKVIVAFVALCVAGLPSVAMAREEESESIRGEVRTTSATQSPSPSPRVVKDASDRQRSLESELRNQLQERQKEREASSQDMKSDEMKAKLNEKLDETKKKACEKNVSTINRLQEVMNKRRQNTVERISKISEAVQSFYSKKQLTVANYEELLAKVAAAKTVAESALEAQQQIPSLDCSGDRPRANVADFKDKRATAIDAVKAYRDAVKDLARAVKTAAGTSASTSPSPTPTATEGVTQ